MFSYLKDLSTGKHRHFGDVFVTPKHEYIDRLAALRVYDDPFPLAIQRVLKLYIEGATYYARCLFYGFEKYPKVLPDADLKMMTTASGREATLLILIALIRSSLPKIRGSDELVELAFQISHHNSIQAHGFDARARFGDAQSRQQLVSSYVLDHVFPRLLHDAPSALLAETYFLDLATRFNSTVPAMLAEAIRHSKLS